MGKDTVKIVVHDRRVEIEISGNNPPGLPAFAERLILEDAAVSTPAIPSPAAARPLSHAAGRVFLDSLKNLLDVLCATLIARDTIILRDHESVRRVVRIARSAD